MIVAAVGDEQIGPDVAGADDAACLGYGGAVVADNDGLFVPLCALERGHHVVIASSADDGVHLGHLGDYLAPVELGEAARDDEPPERARFLELSRLEYGVDGLLFCVLDEGAGVYDDGLGLGLVVRQLIAGVSELLQHLLRGDPVFRAAERDHTDFHSSNSNP